MLPAASAPVAISCCAVHPGFVTATPICVLRRPGETASEAAIRLILGLREGCLPVQGPPGAGKTHMAALAALRLIASGRAPVGVTAVTHNAIRTLLYKDRGARAVARHDGSHAAPEGGRERHGGDPDRPEQRGCRDGRMADGAVDVVGGTSWLFARPEFEARSTR